MLRRAVWSLASSLALVYSAHSSRRDTFKNRSGRGGSYTQTTRRLCSQSLGIRLEAFQWPTVAAVPVTSPSSILVHYCWATGPSSSDCNNRPAPALGLRNYSPSYTRQFPPSPRSLPNVTFDLCRQVFPVHQLKKLDAAISSYPFPALFSFTALRATWHIMFLINCWVSFLSHQTGRSMGIKFYTVCLMFTPQWSYSLAPETAPGTWHTP